MEGYYSTGQSPQWTVVPMEEEEEEEEEEEGEEEEEEEEEVSHSLCKLFFCSL
jgi:ribosomal protein L12E/L44/L45/RPP1/RPP2